MKKIKPIIFVSFPRSGQHLLERLTSFFSRKLGYEFSYCPSYSFCKNCSPDCSIKKDHDLDLETDKSTEKRFLVLFRSNMIEQLEAWHRMIQNPNSNERYNNFQLDYNKKTDLKKMLNFASSRIDYYNGFIKKWVLNVDNNIYKLDYDSFINDHELIINALGFIFEANDKEQLRHILSEYLKTEQINRKTKVDINLNIKE
jgi:hypothetical protein